MTSDLAKRYTTKLAIGWYELAYSIVYDYIQVYIHVATTGVTVYKPSKVVIYL